MWCYKGTPYQTEHRIKQNTVLEDISLTLIMNDKSDSFCFCNHIKLRNQQLKKFSSRKNEEYGGFKLEKENRSVKI